MATPGPDLALGCTWAHPCACTKPAAGAGSSYQVSCLLASLVFSPAITGEHQGHGGSQKCNSPPPAQALMSTAISLNTVQMFVCQSVISICFTSFPVMHAGSPITCLTLLKLRTWRVNCGITQLTRDFEKDTKKTQGKKTFT